MLLKINVGLTKKLWLPEYGSLGASCHAEFEIPGGAIVDDLDGFHRQVRTAFAVCRQAVEEELGRQQPAGDSDRSPAHPAEPAHGNGHTPHANGNGQAGDSSKGHPRQRASRKQMDYARELAGQIRGLGIRRLESLARKTIGKPLAGLSSLDASGLIDLLKDIKSGRIDLEGALAGDPP